MRTRKLAFYLGGTEPHFRQITEGVGDYLQLHPEWEALWQGKNLFWQGPEVWKTEADAVICGALKKTDLEGVANFSGKVVCVSNQSASEPVHCVVSDDVEAGRMAGRHLASLGFRRFAYASKVPFFNFSVERMKGFREIVETVPGARFHPISADASGSAEDMWKESLQAFKPPFAIYCESDLTAYHLAATAPQFGIRVPEDVALLGTDDAPLLTQFCRPRLSSVALSSRLIGQRAAQLFGELESRADPVPLRLRIPPQGVVTRRSTDVTAIEDRGVARALEWLRAHSGKGVTVDDAAREGGMSRRVLEQKFKRLLQRSPHQEILRLRIQKACELLRITDWPIGRIAEEAGFEDIRTFNHAFKNHTGEVPRTWRNAIRPLPTGAAQSR